MRMLKDIKHRDATASQTNGTTRAKQAYICLKEKEKKKIFTTDDGDASAKTNVCIVSSYLTGPSKMTKYRQVQ